MKRIDRMKNMIIQIDNILTGLGPSQANERDIAAILSNLALSYDVPAHIYNEKGRRKMV